MIFDKGLKSIKVLWGDGKIKHILVVSQEKYPRELY